MFNLRSNLIYRLKQVILKYQKSVTNLKPITATAMSNKIKVLLLLPDYPLKKVHWNLELWVLKKLDHLPHVRLINLVITQLSTALVLLTFVGFNIYLSTFDLPNTYSWP